jgi:hypothetical protein
MKYIIAELGDGTQHPIIFPEELNHSDIAGIFERDVMFPWKVVSAGKIINGDINIAVAHGSHTLKMNMDEEKSVKDKQLIISALNATY